MPVQRGQADTVPRGGIHQPPPPPAMPQRNRCCERAQVRVLEQAGRLAGAGEVVACIPTSATVQQDRTDAHKTRNICTWVAHKAGVEGANISSFQIQACLSTSHTGMLYRYSKVLRKWALQEHRKAQNQFGACCLHCSCTLAFSGGRASFQSSTGLLTPATHPRAHLWAAASSALARQ